MRIIALLVALLFFGCVASQEPPANVSDIQLEEKAKNTINTNELSFSRESTDVIAADMVFPEIKHYDFSEAFTGEGKLIVYYFYSTNCIASQELGPEIERMEEAYTETMFQKHNLATSDGSGAYRDFAEQYNLSYEQQLVPQVLVNGAIITDRFNINDSLENIILA